MANHKSTGQIFTPNYLVCDILNIANYLGDSILGKHIIDNSCGDGAFLCEIVRRYCCASKQHNIPIHTLKTQLETYIHGIEIDPEAHKKCIERLDAISEGIGIKNVIWDVILADALTTHEYDGKMDFVVGNPPYVRVHNLANSYKDVKHFSFAEGGMTDLYLVFFEIGFKMLSPRGTLCYITPSSWLNSLAGSNLRNYTLINQNLVQIVDLGHFQPFNATTYTLISRFDKQHQKPSFLYSIYDGDSHLIKDVCSLSLHQIYINGCYYLATPESLKALRRIYTTTTKNRVRVKNGFATLADKVFIRSEFPFSKHIIPVIKASTGQWYKAFYPYDKDGNPFTPEEIFSDSDIKKYLEDHKAELLKGGSATNNPYWYLYGRTQALKDVAKHKIAINTVIKDVWSIKLNEVASNCGIFSGLYILTKIPFKNIEKIIISEEFIDYIKLLKKYKSGGYFTFNSKELECYLNYKLANLDEDNGAEQSNISGCDIDIFSSLS